MESSVDGMKRTGADGVRALFMSLLQDAVDCYQQHIFSRTRGGRHLFQQAERWLMEPGLDADITFEDVCACLQIDADYVRQGLRQWRQQVGTRARIARR